MAQTDKQTDIQTDMATLRLNQPIGADSVEKAQENIETEKQ